MGNIFLGNPSLGPWQWDSTKSAYYLEIGGVRVAEISVNLSAMKGRRVNL